MYYSIYYINLDQLFQKVNIPKDISGSVFDTISEHMRSKTSFLSGQNPYTHCSLYNKLFYYMAGSRSGQDEANPVF